MQTTGVMNLVRLAGEGTHIARPGGEMLFKAIAGETGGAWSLIELKTDPYQTGAPLHYHKVMTEAFYVLEGQVTFTLDGKIVEAGPGSLVVASPGTVHGFNNTTPEPNRFLILASPGGHERFFENVAKLIEAEGQWPPRDMAKLVDMAARHDVYYVTGRSQTA